MKTHWHEHLQFYYFIGGEGVVGCGHNRFQVSTGSLAVINSNELHYLESLSDNLQYYVIRIDPKFLFSNQVDLIQTKYLAPLTQNLITFKNLIENDSRVQDCITNILSEYNEKQTGYELAIKSSIYHLIVLLLRGFVSKVLTKEELDSKAHTLQYFHEVLQIIEEHYTDKIGLRELAAHVNISPCHFCRVFKCITGKTTTDYINGVRLKHAADFLKKQDDNITEIALKCGFDSVNYFSRLFRQYYHVSPTKFRELSSSQS